MIRHWRLALVVILMGLFGAWLGFNSPERRGAATPAERQTFAMGTYARLVVHGPRGGQTIEECLKELTRLEDVFDRFASTSELSRLNDRAGTGWVEVSGDLFAVLELTLDVAERSGGVLDPSVAPLIDLWGLYEQEGRIPDHPPPAAREIAALLESIGYQKIEIDAARRMVKLPKGMRLDLGAIAKGYALDRLVAVASKRGVRSALFDLGGNIRVMGDKPDASPWRVALRHPRRSDDVFAVVPISDRAIATSGDYQRFFMWEERRYSHILDPRSGYPPTGVASVTVVAPTGILSDALSTAAFVLGPDKGRQFLESIPDVEGVYVDEELRMSVTSGLEALVGSL